MAARSMESALARKRKKKVKRAKERRVTRLRNCLHTVPYSICSSAYVTVRTYKSDVVHTVRT